MLGKTEAGLALTGGTVRACTPVWKQRVEIRTDIVQQSQSVGKNEHRAQSQMMTGQVISGKERLKRK